jgi:hypothetical protein
MQVEHKRRTPKFFQKTRLWTQRQIGRFPAAWFDQNRDWCVPGTVLRGPKVIRCRTSSRDASAQWKILFWGQSFGQGCQRVL